MTGTMIVKGLAVGYGEEELFAGLDLVVAPGDVIGLVNATDVRVGDSLWVDEPVTFPTIPSFAPEHFAVIRVRDTGRFKQFRKGIAQLDEEGVELLGRIAGQTAKGVGAPAEALVGDHTR